MSYNTLVGAEVQSPRVQRAQAAYNRDGRLPGIQSSRTPRAAKPLPRAPEPGNFAETLDFTRWSSSEELNNVRWRLEMERKWRQQEEERRQEQIEKKREEALALAEEIKATKIQQKKELGAAADALSSEAKMHLAHLQRMRDAEAVERDDLLGWKKDTIEEERKLRKRELETEKTELLRRIAEAKRRPDRVVMEIKGGNSPNPSVEQLQKAELEAQLEEVRWQLEKHRQVQAQVKLEKQGEAAKRREEMALQKEELQATKIRSEEQRKQMNDDMDQDRVLAEKAAKKAAAEAVRAHADQLEWRKAICTGKVSVPVPPVTQRPSSKQLRQRFMTSTPGERRVIGPPTRRPTFKPRAQTTREERLAAERARVHAMRVRVNGEHERATRKQAEQGQDLEVQVRELWTNLNEAKCQAAQHGDLLNSARDSQRRDREERAAARAQRALELAQKAQQKAADRLAKKASDAQEAARQAEAQAQRVAAELNRQREDRQQQRAKKAVATRARIDTMIEEKQAAAQAAYEENLEKLRQDEIQRIRFEKEEAERRAADGARRAEAEMQREVAGAEAAQAALERAQAVVAEYDEKEKRNQEKAARVQAKRQSKKSATDSRLGEVLARQTRERKETARKFYQAEQEARELKAEQDKQAEIERQRAVQLSMERVNAMQSSNAQMEAERKRQATADERYSEERHGLASMRREILADHHEHKAQQQEKRRKEAYYRARQDHAQALEAVKIGMLMKVI